MDVRIGKRDGNLLVSIAGGLVEGLEAVLNAQLPRLKAAHVIIECSGITKINSVGFRGWLAFLKSLAKDSTFELVGCPPDFIDMCNLLPTTSYAKQVTSLAVPFVCETCRRESAPVFDIHDVSPGRSFDSIICPKCNGTMRARVAPDEYLAFMVQRP